VYTFTVPPQVSANIFSRIRVLEAEIPITWYVLAADNNTFNFVYSNADVAQLSVPVGNYDVNTLPLALATAINAANPVLSDVYSVSVNQSTFCLKIKSSTALPFSIDVTNLKIADVLGLARASYTSDGNGEIIAPKMMRINRESYIYLKCPTIIRGVDNGVLATSADRNILARIQCVDSFGSSIAYATPGPWCRNIMRAQIYELKFYLSFRGDIPVDLNGNNWSCHIEFSRS
jgi:hypothetical protein